MAAESIRGMKRRGAVADEWPLEMDTQDFRAGFLRFVLLGHVSGDSFDGTESLFRAGRYRGGDQRCGAVLRDFAGDGAQRRAGSLHDIVARRPMDMQIDEAGMAVLSVARISRAPAGKVMLDRGPIASMNLRESGSPRR